MKPSGAATLRVTAVPVASNEKPAEILLINLRLVQHTSVDGRVIVHVVSSVSLLNYLQMIVTVLWGGQKYIYIHIKYISND